MGCMTSCMSVFVKGNSVQNGYYSSDVDIFYNGKHVLNLTADIKDEDRF